MKASLSNALALVLATTAFGSTIAVARADRTDPYGWYDDYYGRDDAYERGRYAEEERRDLALERDRLDAERRALEADRNRTAARQTEQCPAGFSQSENKCSPEERRRGCKDVRLSNGMGCVKR